MKLSSDSVASVLVSCKFLRKIDDLANDSNRLANDADRLAKQGDNARADKAREDKAAADRAFEDKIDQLKSALKHKNARSPEDKKLIKSDHYRMGLVDALGSTYTKHDLKTGAPGNGKECDVFIDLHWLDSHTEEMLRAKPKEVEGKIPTGMAKKSKRKVKKSWFVLKGGAILDSPH